MLRMIPGSHRPEFISSGSFALGLAGCLLLAWAGLADAQDVRFGLTGGINMSEINTSGDESLNVAFTHRMEPAGGFFFVFPFSESFWIQPEALFSIKGTDAEFADREGRARLTYLEAPVLVRYAGPRDSRAKIHVFGGPYVGYLIRATARIKTQRIMRTVDVKDELNSLDLGWVAGIGLGGGGFRIDLRYGGSVRNIADQQDLGGLVPVPRREVKYRNRGFALLAGYAF
jgi:hypothetical protein